MCLRRFTSALLLALVACGLDVAGADPDPVTQGDAGSSETGTDGGGVPDAGSGSDGAVGPDTGTSGQGDGAARDPLCVPGPTLLLCLELDGDLVDKARGLTLSGADTVSFEAGREGKAAQFGTGDPTSDVRVPFDPAFNTPRTTLELFAFPTAFPNGGDRSYFLDLQARSAISLTRDGSVGCLGVLSARKIALQRWVHIACVASESKVSLYLDGVLEAQADRSEPLGTTADYIAIGHDSPEDGSDVEALIDNVRIWGDTRTADEIAQAARR